jgi:hypothetical protein
MGPASRSAAPSANEALGSPGPSAPRLETHHGKGSRLVTALPWLSSKFSLYLAVGARPPKQETGTRAQDSSRRFAGAWYARKQVVPKARTSARALWLAERGHADQRGSAASLPESLARLNWPNSVPSRPYCSSRGPTLRRPGAPRPGRARSRRALRPRFRRRRR